MLDVPSLPDSPIRRRVVERANLDITEGNIFTIFMVLNKVLVDPSILIFIYYIILWKYFWQKYFSKIYPSNTTIFFSLILTICVCVICLVICEICLLILLFCHIGHITKFLINFPQINKNALCFYFFFCHTFCYSFFSCLTPLFPISP